MTKYTRLQQIQALLEMTKPHEDYKGGSINWHDAKWMHNSLLKLIDV